MDKRATNEAAVSPARPFHLGGTVYACSPPSISVMAGLMSMAQKKCDRGSPLSAIVNDPAFALLPLAAQIETAKIASQAQVSGKSTVNPVQLAEQMMDLDILAFGIWGCCSPNHPDLTIEAVRKEITEANVAEVFVRYTEASGMLALEKKVSAGESG